VLLSGSTWSLDISDLYPDQILSNLGLYNLDRSIDIGAAQASLAGILGPGLEKLGYVKIGDAIGKCTGDAMTKVEEEIERFREDGDRIFSNVSSDLETRCRSYITFAGEQCMGRTESLIMKLQEDAMEMATEELLKCTAETEELMEKTREEEEERYNKIGSDERERRMLELEARGNVTRIQMTAEFERRGKAMRNALNETFQERGKILREQIETEYEVRGELLNTTTRLNITEQGRQREKEIKAEFDERGEKTRMETEKEFNEKAEEMEKELRKEFTEKGEEIMIELEDECKVKINRACGEVEFDSPSDDFCLEFEFFADDELARLRARNVTVRAEARLRLKTKLEATDEAKVDMLLEIMRQVQERKEKDSDIGRIILKMIRLVQRDNKEDLDKLNVSERLMKIVQIMEDVRDKRISSSERKKIMNKMKDNRGILNKSKKRVGKGKHETEDKNKKSIGKRRIEAKNSKTKIRITRT